MLDIEEIKKRMEDRKLYVVAKKSGLCPRTIYNILNGKNVTLKTLKKLSDYLEGKGN